MNQMSHFVLSPIADLPSDMKSFYNSYPKLNENKLLDYIIISCPCMQYTLVFYDYSVYKIHVPKCNISN